MVPKQEILRELDFLIEQGSYLAAEQHSRTTIFHKSDYPEHDFRAFAIGATACIKRVAGDRSDYLRMVDKTELDSEYARKILFIGSLLGSITALRRAVELNFLETLESKLRANIHDDFLQQAKLLLDRHYHVAAMVLIGGVLEDHLRKLCDNRGFKTSGKGSLSQYNELLKNEYPLANWRQVQFVGDVRNLAAHGEGGKVDPKQVEDAHAIVDRMIAQYPA